MLHRVAERRPWLEIVVTDAQLIVDIAVGHDVVIMGADKWHQVNDPSYYGGDPVRRDDAVARLPTVAVAPRPPLPVPDEHRLTVPDWVGEQSSTAARGGRIEWMLDEARHFDVETGAWSEPARYRARRR